MSPACRKRFGGVAPVSEHGIPNVLLINVAAAGVTDNPGGKRRSRPHRRCREKEVLRRPTALHPIGHCPHVVEVRGGGTQAGDRDDVIFHVGIGEGNASRTRCRLV